MRATWLVDVLRAEGLTVIPIPGWQVRGGELRAIHGVVCHHTAIGPEASDGAVLAILRDGRADLRGPLSQLGLNRAGEFFAVAAGRASHNGYGEWGNDSLGIEAFNSGLGEPWPEVQLDAYARGAAAILKHLHLPVDRCRAHRETDPRRKIDPTGIDMTSFRRRVGAAMRGEDMTPDQERLLRDVHEGLGRLDDLVQDRWEDLKDRIVTGNEILREIRDKLPGSG